MVRTVDPVKLRCSHILYSFCKEDNLLATYTMPKYCFKRPRGLSKSDHDKDDSAESGAIETNKNKTVEEINSALRSIKTNLLTIATDIVLVIVTYSLHSDYHQCINIVRNSIFKTALPILTTAANFGTIQNVLKQFLESVKT